jgi:hypothetical protein
MKQYSDQSFQFTTPSAAAEPVELSQLLDEISEIIRAHVVLSAHAATALALWVVHTYVFDTRDAVAYVSIESPEKRCGKTTLLSVLAGLACRALVASNSIRPEHRVTCTWRVKELNGKSIEYRVLRNGKPDDGVGYLSVIDLDDKTMQISIFPADDSSEFKLNQIEADYIKTHPGKYRFSCFSRA